MLHCRDLDPVEMLLAQMVRVAIRDATQDKDVRLREEASRWLWDHAPGFAQRAGVATCKWPTARPGR